MIDYVKLNVSSALPELNENPLLDWESLLNQKTGEIRYLKVATYKNLKFLIKGNYAELTGSLHYFYNDGIHNWNDFSFSMLSDAIIELCKSFELDPFEVKIRNFEFGFNLKVDFNPRAFLRNRVLKFKDISRSRNQSLSGRGYFVEFERDQYFLKIYDKGLQFRREENILRLEIKTKRMATVKSTGISFLSDLLDIEKIRLLPKFLIKAIDGLSILETVGRTQLSAKDLKFFDKGIMEFNREDLKPDPIEYTRRSSDPEYIKQYKRYSRKKRAFQKFLDDNNLNKQKKYLLDKVKSTSEELLIFEKQTDETITSFLDQIGSPTLIQKGVKFTGSCDAHSNAEMGEIHTLSKWGNSPKLKTQPEEVSIVFSEQSTDSIERQVLADVIKQIVNDFYGGIFTEPEIMSDFTIQILLKECFSKAGVKLSKEEFFSIVRTVLPYNPICPF